MKNQRTTTKRFYFYDRNPLKSTMKIVVYWNEYAKTEVKKTTFYSYEKFDTLTGKFDSVYAFQKLFKLVMEKLQGQYKTVIVYKNQGEQHEQEMIFIEPGGRILLRNRQTQEWVNTLLSQVTI